MQPYVKQHSPVTIVDHLKQMTSFTEFLDGAKFVVVDQLDVLLKEGVPPETYSMCARMRAIYAWHCFLCHVCLNNRLHQWQKGLPKLCLLI